MQAAEEPLVAEAPAVDLLDVLSVDILATLVLGRLGMGGVAASAASCQTLARLCCLEALWQHLVLSEWPLLPSRLRPLAASSGWRDLARERSHTPR